MSTARQCDRCGAFYKPEGGTYLRLFCVDAYGYATGNDETRGDLCDTCSTELRTWFRALKSDVVGGEQ